MPNGPDIESQSQVMKNKARYLVWILAVMSFIYVASGGALAVHLGMHNHECCQDTHRDEHADHGHDKHGDHDSNHCDICQHLGMITKRILVESSVLIPELSITEHSFSYTVNRIIQQHTSLPLLPRAPPV